MHRPHKVLDEQRAIAKSPTTTTEEEPKYAAFTELEPYP